MKSNKRNYYYVLLPFVFISIRSIQIRLMFFYFIHFFPVRICKPLTCYVYIYMSNTIIEPEYALNAPNMLRSGYHPWQPLDFRDHFVQNATKHKTRKQIIIINDIPELTEGWALRVIFIVSIHILLKYFVFFSNPAAE